MNRINLVLTIVVALAAGFAGRAIADARWWASGAVAHAESREPNDGDRWEYCAVLKAQYPGSVRGGLYWIAYFKGDRPDVRDVEVGPSGNALSKAVAQLGNEGWEMVGAGPLEVRQTEGRPGANAPSVPQALFFKRRSG
jgi:hypothetical protein